MLPSMKTDLSPEILRPGSVTQHIVCYLCKMEIEPYPVDKWAKYFFKRKKKSLISLDAFQILFSESLWNLALLLFLNCSVLPGAF